MPKQPPAQGEADKLINRVHAQIVALAKNKLEGRTKYVLEEPDDPVEMFADDAFFACKKAPVKKSIGKKPAPKKSLVKKAPVKKSIGKKPAPKKSLVKKAPVKKPAPKNIVVKDKKELAQKADALIQWMAFYSHEFTDAEINEVFEANGIPYSADYHFMVEDGLFPRATGRKMLEYLNGFIVPENLEETLEVLGPIKERPTRRSERLKGGPIFLPKKPLYDSDDSDDDGGSPWHNPDWEPPGADYSGSDS